MTLLWPLSWQVWITLFSLALSASVFQLAAFQLFQLVSEKDNNAPPEPEKQFVRTKQILFLFVSFLEHDIPRFRESSSIIRCFLSWWLLFTVIMTNLYRSKLASLWTFPIYGSVPSTFESLVDSNYKIGFMKHGDSAYNTLAGSEDPVYVKLVSKMDIFLGSGVGCVQNVAREDSQYGCIGYNFEIAFLIEKNLSEVEKGRVRWAAATTYDIWEGLTTEPKSIFKKTFSDYLMRAREFHFAFVWDKIDLYQTVRAPKLRWWQVTNQTDKTRTFYIEQDLLTLKHISGAFYILIPGMFISAVVFPVEIFIWICRSRKIRPFKRK